MLESFQDVYLKDIPRGLPPIRGIEHQIDFTIELLTELTQRRVEKSKSSCVVLVILVTKKDRFWRMCIDYCPINSITIRYKHCLDDLLDELHGTCIFSKINLHSRYHQIRM
ncbi:hypothetical protein CR513_09997, partial [Mucuna pruriens]